MEEYWKDVIGYENDYEISSSGNIRSKERYRKNRNGYMLVKSQIIKPHNHPKGYLRITLARNNTKANFFVHRLVAQAFIPNLENLPQINHKDGNKKNNSIENLEWCDNNYNRYHAVVNNLHSTLLKKEDVKYIRESSQNSYELANLFKVTRQHINRIKRKRFWKHI
jgi:hypothetical protein